MEEFINWLNSDENTNINAIIIAATCHYHITETHCFVNGNGRTARLLMALILLKAGFPLVIILLNYKF
jgi:Fic family protein